MLNRVRVWEMYFGQGVVYGKDLTCGYWRFSKTEKVKKKKNDNEYDLENVSLSSALKSLWQKIALIFRRSVGKKQNPLDTWRPLKG
ncbi:Uncharacterized protein FWK35_00002635 [Aphis craccivora]|uniref:Uncharacterized protein n=1 Tax=Aphis craccivora TaxID=307492 RepID=A0A6G0ZS11_APHCR|nr:Uncharacterized protein FWK35_00002635 [Aphis craccivora]